MRKSLCFILVIGLLIFNSTTFAADVPTLFGFKWGSSVDECHKNGMKSNKVIIDEKTNTHSYMDFRNAGKTIGKVRIDTIGYIFSDNKLSSLMCKIEGSPDFRVLKNALIKKYGKPNEVEPMRNVYGHEIGIDLNWKVGVLHIDLKFNFAKKDGWLSYNNSIYNEKSLQYMEKDTDSTADDL